MNKPTSSTLRYCWFVVALLFPVAVLNYLDRQMLATMKASITTDIPDIANKADWGMILACFKWTYAILSPFGGFIADRVSKKHVIALSLFLWSAITWWTGHTHSFQELLAARALMGVSEAFYIPTALALIAEYHQGPTRSRAIGFHQMGIYFGQILGGFAGYAADSPAHGWRWAFTTCGICGILYSIPLFKLLRAPNQSHASLGNAEKVPKENVHDRVSIRGLLSDRNFILLLLYFTLPAIAGWVVRDWMPEILREKFSLGQGSAGVSAILYVQIFSLIGAVVGGFLADRWTRSSVRGRIFTSALGTLLFLPALFSVGNAATLTVAVFGLAVFGLGWGMFDCNNMPILCQVVGQNSRATGYGIMNLVSITCGGFGDWTFGALRDQNVPLNLIFACFSGIAILSVAVVLMIRPRES
jgi:MFS family permease